MKTAGILILISTLALVGCASDGGSGGSAGSAEVAVPESSPLSKVSMGMDDAQVRKTLGDPDDSSSYMTGKQWIPFYFGPDTHRTDWLYKGQGRVVFSRNQYSGGLKVINVLYNSNELQ